MKKMSQQEQEAEESLNKQLRSYEADVKYKVQR